MAGELPARGETDFRPVKSAYRALDVLEAMAAGPATLSELSRRLDIPKSSLHALLRTQADRGWVEPEVFESLDRPRHDATDRLAAQTDETVQQALLDGDEVVYLAKRDSAHPVRLMSSLGSRLPAHATALGKALLAAREDSDLRDVLDPPLRALTARTITTWESLRAELEATRERGYAVDDGETADGLRCFAVTVPQEDWREGTCPPTDAISVSVPTFRLHEQREKIIITALLEAQVRLEGAFPPAYGGR